MATIEEKFLSAIKKLRETSEKKNFDQTVDIIVNLKQFDVRREAFNIFIQLPNKIKDSKVLGFFEKDSKVINTIKKEEFPRYKEKKDIKKLVRDYDFFVSNAKLMPAVATSFGRVLGPFGKMPSPQLGILPTEDDKIVEAVVNKINLSVRVKVKEPSIKASIGKQSMGDEKLEQNAVAFYNKIVDNLPKKIDNVRNVKIKLTMSKPVTVEL
jgi:large subunit ribosomal protein L1